MHETEEFSQLRSKTRQPTLISHLRWRLRVSRSVRASSEFLNFQTVSLVLINPSFFFNYFSWLFFSHIRCGNYKIWYFLYNLLKKKSFSVILYFFKLNKQYFLSGILKYIFINIKIISNYTIWKYLKNSEVKYNPQKSQKVQIRIKFA